MGAARISGLQARSKAAIRIAAVQRLRVLVACWWFAGLAQAGQQQDGELAIGLIPAVFQGDAKGVTN